MNLLSSKLPKDPSRISITAHLTGYSWYAKDMSHEALVTRRGRFLYHAFSPWMWIGRTVLGLADLISGLQQRHMILDHLLEKAVCENGVRQVIELACGLSPRGFRFMKSHQGMGIRYLEADLPHMAERKRKTLENAGLLSEGHMIVPCNILADDGEHCLRELARRYIDPTQPAAIITEGIINYFDPDTIQSVWRRIGDIFNEGAGGIYLTDNCPMQKDHRYFFFLDMFFKIMGMISRGKLYYHFSSDDMTKQAFSDLAFRATEVYRPENFYETLPIPQSRHPAFIRVIEAVV